MTTASARPLQRLHYCTPPHITTEILFVLVPYMRHEKRDHRSCCGTSPRLQPPQQRA
jgi:hypothetical protein